MARYRGPKCKLCRREKLKLFLKDSRCFSSKCGLEKRKGEFGGRFSGGGKVSEYGLQLREKQKAKIIYGVLEAQFKRYFRLAERKKGVTSDNLVVLLERRLDNVVFKLGFAGSRSAARQLTTHNHILVNQKRVNIPSYLVKVGDVIEIREKSRNIVRAHLQSKIEKEVPSWLQLSSDRLKGTVLRIPTRAEIEPLYDPQSIVEFYSK